jgi:hypothetical protein
MFSVALAERYGPIESIILSNICWWVETNRKNGKHFYDGRYWTYGSASGFEKIFTYLKPEQIRYTLRNLREQGALLTGNYNRMKYDRTLWYTVSDEVKALYEGRTAFSGADRKTKDGRPPDPEEEAGGKKGGSGGENAEISILEGAGEGLEKTGEAPVKAGKSPGGAEPAAGGDGNRERPKDHSHDGNFHNANGRTAAPIMEISAMDYGNFHDPLWKFPSPIPLLNNYKKAAAAGGESEHGKKTETDKEAAAVFPIKASNETPNLREYLISRRDDLVFDDAFYPRALAWMDRQDLDAGYIGWLIERCEKRKPDNLRGLFYRMFFAADLATLYRSRGVLPPRGEEAGGMRCPACGAIHESDLRECPRCGLARDRYGDAEEVERQKRINTLAADVRREYEAEMKAAFFAMAGEKGGSGKYRDQWIAVQKKYHLIS